MLLFAHFPIVAARLPGFKPARHWKTPSIDGNTRVWRQQSSQYASVWTAIPGKISADGGEGW